VFFRPTASVVQIETEISDSVSMYEFCQKKKKKISMCGVLDNVICGSAGISLKMLSKGGFILFLCD